MWVPYGEITRERDAVITSLINTANGIVKQIEARNRYISIILTLALILAVLGSSGLVVRSVIRSLAALRSVATAIAEGNFETQADSLEKGDIGELMASIQQIPAVLRSIQSDYAKLENRIEAGELDALGDSSVYKGSFAKQVESTNVILKRFHQVLDNIPAPVMALNKDLKITYINTTGRELVGEDYKGKTQVLMREDAATPADALKLVLIRRVRSWILAMWLFLCSIMKANLPVCSSWSRILPLSSRLSAPFLMWLSRRPPYPTEWPLPPRSFQLRWKKFRVGRSNSVLVWKAQPRP
jgi:PAS domain-containing protein